MTHFFHQLRLYITFEVIEPAWLHMNARMKAAKTLDEVMICTTAPCCTQTHARCLFHPYPQPTHMLDVFCRHLLLPEDQTHQGRACLSFMTSVCL